MKRILILLVYAASILNLITGCRTLVPTPDVSQPSAPPAAAATTSAHANELEPGPAENESFNDRIPLIFSHDGAPDDITAMAYIAKHPRIDLLGVVNSYGEQHPSRSADEWARFMYEIIDMDEVPLAIGSETSLDPAQNEFPASWRDGADDFWGINLPAGSGDYTFADGADLIINLVHGSTQPVTILITGAHTDMALALRKDPGIAKNINRIVIMGGAFNGGGNLNGAVGTTNNNVAEWNIYVDALAAKEVFNSGIPLSVISLDGSDNFVITQADINRIQGSSDSIVGLVNEMWEWSFMVWGGDFKIWDIVAAVALTNPELITWSNYYMDVIAEPGNTHGQTITRDENPNPSGFSVSTDFDGVKNQVFEVLLGQNE